MLHSISVKFKLSIIKYICISVPLLFVSSTIEAQNTAGHRVTIRVIPKNSFTVEAVRNAVDKQDGLTVTDKKADGFNLNWSLSGANKRVTVYAQNEVQAGSYFSIGAGALKISTTPQDITDSVKNPAGKVHINYSGIADRSAPVSLCYTIVDS